MTLQFDEFLKIRYPFHRRFLFAPLESPKFALHSYQTLDTYTILYVLDTCIGSIFARAPSFTVSVSRYKILYLVSRYFFGEYLLFSYLVYFSLSNTTRHFFCTKVKRFFFRSFVVWCFRVIHVVIGNQIYNSVGMSGFIVKPNDQLDGIFVNLASGFGIYYTWMCFAWK